MKIVSPNERAPKAGLASHFLQVYRPIDNEKLKSQAEVQDESLQLCGCIPLDGLSTPHLFHDKHSLDEEPVGEDDK